MWKGIRWRKLAPADPLAHVQSMTRWRGGFVAVGDLLMTDGAPHSRVWVSNDGATWNLLGVDVFGPGAVVVGIDATADKIVALTLQSGTNFCDDTKDAMNCWNLTAPFRSWTSSDGTTWTAHDVPNGVLGEEVTGESGAYPILRSGTADHLLAIARGQRLAISDDGIAWRIVPAKAFPAGWRSEDVVAVRSGFIAFGSTTTKSLVLSSRDGLAWTSQTLQPFVGNQAVTVGSTGVIAMGLQYLDGGLAKWFWWSSIDGLHWTRLSGYPPLGAMTGQAAQECRDACPNGILVGNGERMFAYRGSGTQRGWASFNGRSWQPLAFIGGRPSSSPGLSDPMSVILMPAGIKLHNLDGSFWFGTPIT